MKKSIIANGRRITRGNLIKFVSRPEYLGRHPLRDYLCYLEGVEKMPLRLDHWSEDYTMHVYQAGRAWVAIYREDVDVVAGWLRDAGIKGYYEED
jgi:hypothetical protein